MYINVQNIKWKDKINLLKKRGKVNKHAACIKDIAGSYQGKLNVKSAKCII